jgi:tetratricopeptide (TPR) repeat protein
MTTFVRGKKIQIFIIAILCMLININTISNEYALDDEMVIKKNMFVHKGFAGILEILSNDAYRSYLNYEGANNTNLAGGRFRPLSIVSFAIEQNLFGKVLGKRYLEEKEKLKELEQTANNTNDIETQRALVKKLDKDIDIQTLKLAPIRHIFQILYYTLCCLLLYWFISLALPNNKWLPFVAAILFVVHPIHTEVVANIKSRDEVFSLSFILLTCIFYVKFFQHNKNKFAWLAILFYILAFLSKEYAFTLIFLLPLYHFLSYKTSFFTILKSNWFLSFALITILLLGIRYIITNSTKTEITDVLNDPYLYAQTNEVLPSKIVTWLKYLQLLFLPTHLSCDYSFNTFPYVSYRNTTVIASLVIWLGIVAYNVYAIMKRKFIAFALSSFLLFFLLINNLFFDIGATMGERLIFHSSAAFCGILAWVITKLLSCNTSKVVKASVVVIISIIVLISSYKTWLRNTDWKNNFTLFTKDVQTNKESAMLNSNAGSQYFSQAILPYDGKVMTTQDSIEAKPFLQTSLKYSAKAIHIYPRHVNSHTNIALTYWYLNQYDSAVAHWKIACQLFNGRNQTLAKQATLLLNKGLDFGTQKNYTNAIKMIESASIIDPYNPSIWNNLGGAYFMNGNLQLATIAFTKALQLNPNLQDARNGLNTANYQLSLKK